MNIEDISELIKMECPLEIIALLISLINLIIKNKEEDNKIN